MLRSSCTATCSEREMRSVTERGMLVEPRSSMLTAVRGVASRVRRCTAAWGCAKLATESCSQAQPSRATPHFRSVSHQRASCNHARDLSTFAAASTRHTPNMLDPGDYEAGQIQVGAEGLQCSLCFRDLGLHECIRPLPSSMHLLASGVRRPGPSSQAPWDVYR